VLAALPFLFFFLVGSHTCKIAVRTRFSIIVFKGGEVVDIFYFGSQARKHLFDVSILLVTQAEGK